MEGNKNKPRALLVFGAPCSGKTTFAEKFAKKFGLVFYNLDEIVEAGDFSRKGLLVLLEQITKTGNTLVLEGGLNTEKDRKEIIKSFRKWGYDPSLIWIQTDISTIRVRMKAKYKTVAKAKELLEQKSAELEAPSEAEKPIILSGKHTFETQTKHVLAGLADGS